METVRVRIYRFDPEVDQAPRHDAFEVPRSPWMRVIDVLDYVHETLAVDIAYREPAQDEMTIEPLRGLPVIRDLVTSREPFDEGLARLDPLLDRRAEYPGFPEPLSHAVMARSSSLRDCIQCLACHAACPVVAEPGSGFGGPALLVALAELALDPRDGGDRARAAHEQLAVFKCVSCYECERVCPMEIPVVGDAIEPLKRKVYEAGLGAGAEHARIFLDVVKERGRVSAPQLVRRTKGTSLEGLATGLRMIARGKVSAGQALRGSRVEDTETIRRLYEQSE